MLRTSLRTDKTIQLFQFVQFLSSNAQDFIEEAKHTNKREHGGLDS